MHCLVSSIGFPTNISSANPVLSSERYSFSGEGRAFHIHPFLEKKEKDHQGISPRLYNIPSKNDEIREEDSSAAFILSKSDGTRIINSSVDFRDEYISSENDAFQDGDSDMVDILSTNDAFRGDTIPNKSRRLKIGNPHWSNVGMGEKKRLWDISLIDEIMTDEKLPSIEMFIHIVQECKIHKNSHLSMKLHLHICMVGLEAHRELGNYIIPMFVQCGDVYYAEQISYRMPCKNEIAWTSLIQGFVGCGETLKAFSLLEVMQEDGIHPGDHTYVAILKASSKLKEIQKGHQIHDKIIKGGFVGNSFIENALVDMYAKCGSFLEAKYVFDKQPVRNVVLWTSLVMGYAQCGLVTEALDCIQQMQEEDVFLDSVIFVCGLKACSGIRNVDKGQQLHADVVKEGFEMDKSVACALVDMYVKCGHLKEAEEVFDQLIDHDVVVWNALITGYADHGLFEEWFTCFKQMRGEGVCPDAVTYLGSLKLCCNVKAIGKGRELHMDIVKQGLERNLSISNSLVAMYAKTGLLEEASIVFDAMLVQDVVSWTILITGHAESGFVEEAWKSFEQMQRLGVLPNVVTFLCMLKTCIGIGAIERGRALHYDIIKAEVESDSTIGNALVTMYCNCGSLREAWDVFNELSVQDVVSWSAIILGHANHGENEFSFTLYRTMQEQGLLPNGVTFVSVLTACSDSASLEAGRRIHTQMNNSALLDQTYEVITSTALIHMYCKCGSIKDAHDMFDAMPRRERANWNALITGYSQQGETGVVLNLFEEMRAQTIVPDGVTFLGVLSACSHAGLVSRGIEYFDVMIEDYNIEPSIRHCNCIIDLLGRAGQLEEAISRLKSMQVEPNYVTWNSLLGACKKWGNVEIGREAFECAVKLNEKHDAAYLLMFQIYEDAHMFEDAKKIEALRMKFVGKCLNELDFL